MFEFLIVEKKQDNGHVLPARVLYKKVPGNGTMGKHAGLAHIGHLIAWLVRYGISSYLYLRMFVNKKLRACRIIFLALLAIL